MRHRVIRGCRGRRGQMVVILDWIYDVIDHRPTPIVLLLLMKHKTCLALQKLFSLFCSVWLKASSCLKYRDESTFNVFPPVRQLNSLILRNL